VIGEPPLLAGGFHEILTVVEVMLPETTAKFIGGSGTVALSVSHLF
jgi:hypothetical protein